MKIQNNCVVTFDYILRDADGQEIDRAENGEFSYLHGASHIIMGLEAALLNKQTGDELQVDILPKNAYGEYDESLVQIVPSEMFGAINLEVGGQFHAETPKGEPMVVTIRNIEGDQITIDGNHALAGVELDFDLSIIEVRQATDDEIEHGHVHDADGCSESSEVESTAS